MIRGVAKFIVGSAVLLSLAGCGLFRFEERAPWRDRAERECLNSGLVKVTPYIEPAKEIDGPGACGMVRPLRVSAFAEGNVALSSRALLACPMLPAVDRWLTETVMPAAQLYFRTELAEMKVGSYACRNQNNRRGGPRSEHAFGNALDVMAFVLADGRTITIARGWRGTPQEQGFLREVFIGSCRIFSTVLGPGADAFHYDHFHMDLARHHDGRRICKPIIKFEPRIDPSMKRTPMTPRPFDPKRPKPSDVEDQPEDFDGAQLPGSGRTQVASAGGAVAFGTASGGTTGRVEAAPLAPLPSAPAQRPLPTGAPTPLSTLPPMQNPPPAAPGRPQPLAPVASVPPPMPSAPPPRGPLILGTPAPGAVMPPPRPPVMGGLY